MKPTTRISIAVFCALFTFFVAGVIIIYIGRPVVTAAVIFMLIVATAFASSSKFTKEVAIIFLWQGLTRRRLNEYPQTPKEREAARPGLYDSFIIVIHLLRDKRTEIAQWREKGNTGHLGLIEAEEHALEERSIKYWRVLQHFHQLPFDPVDQEVWKDFHSFMAGVMEDESILEYMQPNSATCIWT
jgi:hypothetical protein